MKGMSGGRGEKEKEGKREGGNWDENWDEEWRKWRNGRTK